MKKLTKPRLSVSTSVLVTIASHHTKTRITKPVLKVMREHKKQVKKVKKVLRKSTLKVMKIKKTLSVLRKKVVHSEDPIVVAKIRKQIKKFRVKKAEALIAITASKKRI